MLPMSIGQLAQTAGVGVDTVRYYEKQGLMPRAARRASGYREYRDDDLRRLRFIRRAKQLGFSLEEIMELLALKTQSARSVERVKTTARQKLQAVDNKIAELQRLRTVLAELIAACPGHGATDACPILHAFENSEGTEI